MPQKTLSLGDRIKRHYSHNRPAMHVHFEKFTYHDYDYIDEGIYVGTNQCCTAGLSEVLKKEGIQADLSLEAERLDQPFGVKQYIWLPTDDDNVPTREQLDFAVESLKLLVKNGEKVYLHCKHGHGRSCTFVSAYFIATRGYTPEEAFNFIKSHRPSARMHPVQHDFVKSYYEALKTEGKLPAKKD